MSLTNDKQQFDSFISTYAKQYTQEEYKKRLAIFAENSAMIRAHNRRPSSYKLEINEFADMADEEFELHYTSTIARPEGLTNIYEDDLSIEEDLPERVDWAEYGATTKPRNQRSCGACYGFAAAEAIEGIRYIQTGVLQELSMQQILDCSGNYGNNGCGGGLMNNAFDYIMDAGGLESYEDYPYEAMKLRCKADSKKFVTNISGYRDVPPNDEEALKEAVARQPVTVGIQSNQYGFKYYKSGVMTGNCNTALDHAVLVVGYGTEDGVDYWKIKNSWGDYWGEGGYIKIERGTNKCGVATIPSYPLFNN